MKKLLLLLGIFALSFKLVAQPAFVRPTETSIVKDSSGMVYPYLAWNKLMMSGDYAMRAYYVGTDSVKYLLVKRSQKEKDALYARMPKPVPSDQFKVGDKFSPFKDKDLAGEKVDLKLWAGKVIVLNFWFIGCPPCRAEIPDLNKIALQYKNNPDVVFVAVALDEGYQVKDYVSQNPLSYHLMYGGQYLAKRYDVHLYPTNVVIGRDGKVAYSSQGGSPANPYWIRKTIDEALAVTANTTTAAK